ncbi:MAG: hypothetical protein ACR2NZ_00710 [Rubripirellula sp.]
MIRRFQAIGIGISLRVVGCGGNADPTYIDGDDIQAYVESNAEEITRNAEIEARIERQGDSELQEYPAGVGTSHVLGKVPKQNFHAKAICG